MIRKTILVAPALVLAALAALVPVVSPVSAAGPDGAALFRQRCATCHVAPPGAQLILGPSLAGVVGRKAASTKFNYSPALKASKLTWTRANLDRFLSGPARMVPGTRMVITVADTQQRAAILDYLAHP